jgi:hypothetical protein
MLNREEIQRLTDEITKNPDTINELSDEQIVELHKSLNEHGFVETTDKSYANISIFNWRDAYMRRLITTAFVGFLYRRMGEYVPKSVELLEVEYSRKIAEDSAALAERDKMIKNITDKTRSGVKKFLDSVFEFNPEEHLRAASTKELSTIIDSWRSKLEPKPEPADLGGYQAALSAVETLRATLKVVHGEAAAIISRKIRQLEETLSLYGLAGAYSDTEPAIRATPVEVFYDFDRYLNNTYEQLREVTHQLYLERPDIEFSIIYHGSFDSPEAAREFRLKNEEVIKHDVLTIENHGITMLGPFNENRERAEFYNKNTVLLKGMMEQLERDQRLGKDLIEKRVKREKGKDIAKHGPDAPGLANYINAINTTKDLGAKKGLTPEEQEKLADAMREKEQYEVPDDAIQMDTFYVAEGENGPEMRRSIAYTRAEALKKEE